MPENVLKKWYARVLPPWKACFLAAVAVGLLAHLYKLTNWLPNWDSLVFRYDPQNMLGIGRWFLPVVCAPSSFYDLPFLNGLLAILFHAVGAVFICRLLDVQKRITAVLIGAVIVSFPTVTSVMMYNYVADGYAIAFLFSVLAAWLLMKDKPRYLPAAVLVALSAGIYQAYVTVTIMLIVLNLLDNLLFHGATVASTLKKGVGALLAGAGGMLLYSVILKLLLWVFSAELLDYQGINSTAALAGLDLLGSLYIAKETLISCFFDFSKGVSVHAVLNVLIFAVTVFYYAKQLIQSKLYKKPLTLLAVAVLCVMLPLGAGALAFINAGVDYHSLMRMGYAVFYLFPLLLYERGTERCEVGTAVKRWAVLLTAVLLIGNHVVIANVSYHKAQMAYEKSYGVLVRIADRLEQTPEAAACEKLAVLGALEGSEAYRVVLPPDITGITDGYILRADDEIVGQSVLCSALNDYCGTSYAFVSGEEKQAIAEKAETLGVWPAKD